MAFQIGIYLGKTRVAQFACRSSGPRAFNSARLISCRRTETSKIESKCKGLGPKWKRKVSAKLTRHHVVSLLAGGLWASIRRLLVTPCTTAGRRSTSLPCARCFSSEFGRNAASPVDCCEVSEVHSLGRCSMLVARKKKCEATLFSVGCLSTTESTSEVRGPSPRLGRKIMSAYFQVSGATFSAGCEIRH